MGRFTDLASSGPYLAITEPTLLQHLYLGLSKDFARFLDLASRGAFLRCTVGEGKKVLAKILENTPHTNDYNEPPEEQKESIPKQRESSMDESPPLPSKDSAIDPEPQIPQISKGEEIHHLNLSFNYEAKLLSDLAGFENALNYHFQKRPLKKHLSKPLKKGPLQKSSKSTSSYASNSHVVHQEKFEMSDELPQGMSSEPI